eukprot:Rhum_TRINITY_DN14458_c0_g1::Rhum_TRINITY_DN14458_c0_g1_i1::g.89378::m.89378
MTPQPAVSIRGAASDPPRLGSGAGATQPQSVTEALMKAAKGGLAGCAAGLVQVVLFMSLRTAMNHQYAHGGTLRSCLRELYAEGGIARFYKGFAFAVIQAPISRFGDTFMQTAAVLLCAHFMGPGTSTAMATGLGSVLGALFRILTTPIDTLKTTLQVHGDTAYALLMKKVAEGGCVQLFAGWEANFVASWAGSFPWFYTFNTLNALWPKQGWDGPWRHVRNGAIGMFATAASDVVSNCVRVVKTIRQTHPDSSVGYFDAAKEVLRKQGLSGLLGRGLATRLLVNVLQGVFFTVLWRALSE